MRRPKPMVVAGVMSGTSADGVDVALVRITPGRAVPKIEVIGHSEFPYAKAVREAVLRAASGEMKVAELSRLHWRLGDVYAKCVEKACAKAKVAIVRSHLSREKTTTGMEHSKFSGVLELVGMHGQTIFHEAPGATWQIGEAAVLRERLVVPVVSDFRAADLAAGGQGAPLVPMLDYCMFHSRTKNRVLLNLGGIANVTVIPAGAALEEIIAFDTGPANMAVDSLMTKLFARGFDAGGRTAAAGRPVHAVVKETLQQRYFRSAPPKSCGREQFGAEFAQRIEAGCRAVNGTTEDVIATATEISAQSILEAYRRFCSPRLGSGPTELIAAGGGTKNAWLMRRVHEGFGEMGVTVQTIDEFGVSSQAKEAVAFALLGWLSWHGLAGNVPSATGAREARVLGKSTC